MGYKEIVERASAGEGFDSTILEKCLRLGEILDAIANEEKLGMLVFKGGTALNFGYLKDWKRLSVDLDFNAIGTKEIVMVERDTTIKPIINDMGKSLGYDVKERKHRHEISRYDLYYEDIVGRRQYVKVEISFTSRTSILPVERKEFNFPFIEKKVNAPVLGLEELLAEKLSALYGRRKGRDIFDAYTTMSLSTNMELLRKILIYKLAISKTAFRPVDFFKNIVGFPKKNYEDDLKLIVKGNLPEFETVKKSVIDYYEPLKKLDEADMLFIEFCRECFGEQISKASMAKIGKSKEIMHPLKMLFGDLGMSEEAGNLTADELRTSLAYKRK